MKIDFSVSIPIFIRSYESGYSLGITIGDPGIQASINLQENTMKIRSPCPNEINTNIQMKITKTFIKPKINLNSYCQTEKILFKLINRMKNAENLLNLDDFVDTLHINEQEITKTMILGGVSLLYSSVKQESTIPMIYLPPPPRLQIILIEKGNDTNTYESLSRKVKLTTLMSILGVVNSVWKDNMSLIDDFLTRIAEDLYESSNYISTIPLIPTSQENVYLSLLPRSELGCPTKLNNYRKSLFDALEKENLKYSLIDISHGLRVAYEK